MFCIIAFVVLSILGIFSATNRTLAKEAMDCVFRRVTFRPCNTGFDEKMKAKILGSVLTRSEVAARLINKNFEVLSWIFFILMVLSTFWAARGIYLFYVTGSCNGVNESAFCVFDPSGEANKVSGPATTCKIKPTTIEDLTLKGVDLSSFPVENPDAKDKIVMVGCYGCDYTRKAYPMIREMVNQWKASFTFLDYPVKTKTDFLTRVGYCAYRTDPQKYWPLNDRLFATDKTVLEDEGTTRKTLTEVGYNAEQIMGCTTDLKTLDAVTQQMNEVTKTQFFGTPTIFINGQVFVGPKPYRVYAIQLKGLFYWLQ
jgi:hypothetical protein